MNTVLEKFIIIFLSIFLFSYLSEGLAKLKYIGLYGAIILYLIQLFTNKKEILESYTLYWKTYKTLFVSLFIFLGTILISILFAYADIQPSLREFRIEFLNIGIFSLIALSIKDRFNIFKYFFVVMVLAFLYDVIIFFYGYLKINPELNFSIRLDRNYSIYFEMLFPFMLAGIFLIKSKIKYLFFVILFIGILELILTGARGSWVTVLFELFLFLSVVLYLDKQYFKNIMIGMTLFGIVSVSGTYYLYAHSSLIKAKMTQGFNSSGRDAIIKTRLPIFMQRGNVLVGIGGPGNYQYNKLLNDYHAPRLCGSVEGTKFKYWADEPFIFHVFYKEGLLGLFSFLALVFIFLRKGMSLFTYQYVAETRYFLLALFTSFMGFFLVRGLVEGRQLQYLVLYLVLYLLVPKDRKA